MPSDIGWYHTLGSATLTAFLVQALTGVILAMYYKPDPDSAYESIQHITNDLTLGWLVRGMHRWGASVFIILMFFHMARVFLFGAYKYPRELNWIIGVLILATGMFEGFTGYLLPWDQTAYWASVVGININGTAPFVGPFLAPLPSRRRRDRARHAAPLLCAAHARDSGRAVRAHRPAPLPRRPPRRVAEPVDGGGGARAPAPKEPQRAHSSVVSRRGEVVPHQAIHVGPWPAITRPPESTLALAEGVQPWPRASAASGLALATPETRRHHLKGH